MSSNPSPSSVFSQFTSDLQTATQGVPGMVSSQVLVGHIEFFRHEEFYKQVSDGGFYFIIGLPSGDGSFFNYNGEFSVTADLFYPVPADQTFNWQSVNDQIGALISGWSTFTQPGTSAWPKGQNRGPVRFKFDEPFIRYDVKPFGKFLEQESFIASTQFTFTVPYITSQAANVFLNPPAS